MDIKRLILSAALLGLAGGAFAQGAGSGATTNNDVNGLPQSVVPPQSTQPQPFSPQGTTQTVPQP